MDSLQIDDIDIRVENPLDIAFRCPRCKKVSRFVIGPGSLSGGMSVTLTCLNTAICGVNTISFDVWLTGSGWVQSELDVPLTPTGRARAGKKG